MMLDDDNDEQQAEEFLEGRLQRSQEQRRVLVDDFSSGAEELLELSRNWQEMYERNSAQMRDPEELDLYGLTQQVSRELDFFEQMNRDLSGFIKKHFVFTQSDRGRRPR